MTARDLFNKLKESRAAKATKALADFVAGGGHTVPIEVYNERMSTCEACDFFSPGEYPRCDDCGCFLKLKCSFPAERCPQSKWGPIRVPKPSNTSKCPTC